MNKSQTLYIAARRRGMSPVDARSLVGASVRLGGAQWRAFTTWADSWELGDMSED